MFKRILCFTLCIGLSGCAGAVASWDVDKALQKAADLNVQNVQVAINDIASIHNKSTVKLEKSFERDLASVENGPQALKFWKDYKEAKGQLLVKRDKHLSEYRTMMSNSLFMKGLIDERISISKRIWGFLGRFPAVAQIRDFAETEMRDYVNRIGEDQ